MLIVVEILKQKWAKESLEKKLFKKQNPESQPQKLKFLNKSLVCVLNLYVSYPKWFWHR